jgi:predicted nucleotidyltransferase
VVPASIRSVIQAALEPRAEVLDGYVFGSVARGDDGPNSDIDIAVFLEPSTEHDLGPWGRRASLLSDLMAALGRNDVDLVVLNDASPLLWRQVLRDGDRVLSRDLAATTTREARAISRWCDWKPVQDRIDALLLKRAS